MFCKKCGSQLPDNAKFCDKCNTKLKKFPILKVVAIIEGILIVMLAAVVFILGSVIVDLESSVTETSISDQTEDAAKAIQKNFDILNIELVEVDKTSYEKEIISTYKITNMGNTPIKNYSVKYAYYDVNDTMICTDERYSDVLLDPNKSANMDTYSDVNGNKDIISTIKPVSYSYETTDGQSLSINLQTNEYTLNY